MRSSALVGITLTLIMLLLVAVAAFIFLFQGRQTLESRNQSLSSDLQKTEDERDAVVGTRGAMAIALATAESDSILLEGQLVDTQQEIDELTTELTETGDALIQLEQERLDMLARPPQIEILSPSDGVDLLPNVAVEIAVAAADPVGITEMTIRLNDREIGDFVAPGLPLLTATANWIPEEDGLFFAGS